VEVYELSGFLLFVVLNQIIKMFWLLVYWKFFIMKSLWLLHSWGFFLTIQSHLKIIFMFVDVYEIYLIVISHNCHMLNSIIKAFYLLLDLKFVKIESHITFHKGIMNFLCSKLHIIFSLCWYIWMTGREWITVILMCCIQLSNKFSFWLIGSLSKWSLTFFKVEPQFFCSKTMT